MGPGTVIADRCRLDATAEAAGGEQVTITYPESARGPLTLRR